MAREKKKLKCANIVAHPDFFSWANNTKKSPRCANIVAHPKNFFLPNSATAC